MTLDLNTIMLRSSENKLKDKTKAILPSFYKLSEKFYSILNELTC